MHVRRIVAWGVALVFGTTAPAVSDEAPTRVPPPPPPPSAPAPSGLPSIPIGTPPAADPAAPAAAPAAGAPFGTPGADRTLRLTLGEATRMALGSNLRLQAGRYDVPIACEEYTYQVAQFDTLLTAGFEVAHDEEPTTSAFFGREVVSEDAVRASAGLSRRLHSGGRVSFLYQADRLSTDSLFVTTNPSWRNGAVVEATQPLLRGAGDQAMNDIRRARNAVAIATGTQRAQEDDVLLEVAVAYWGLAFAQEELASRQKSVEVAAELLEDAKARLDAQVGTPLDVADARAGLEQRRGELIVTENARRDVSDRLRALVLPFTAEDPRGILLLAAEDARTADTGPDPDPTRADDYARTAIGTRPDVAASFAELANRGIDVYAAADLVRPQLDLTGRVGTGGLGTGYGTSLEDAVTGEALSAAVGLEFSMFLGRRAAKAQYRQAEWARRQAVLRHKDLENRVVTEVRTSLRDIGAARARLAAGAAEVAAAEEGLDGERERLKQSRSTPFRVLEKEEDLSDARTREARAAADLRIAHARFWRALGMLAEQVGGRTAGPPASPR